MKMQWKIGNVEIPNPFVLAPMAGVTDLAFRRLCKEQGAGLICMEMVSAKAISFHNKNTEALMEIDPERFLYVVYTAMCKTCSTDRHHLHRCMGIHGRA